MAGAGVFSYPYFNAMVYDNEVADLKAGFIRDIKNLPAPEIDPEHPEQPPRPAYDRLYEYLKAENVRIFETGQAGLTDAFSYEQPAVDLSKYGIKENRIGFISIPSIKVELPLYLGANIKQMRKGAVHLTQTSYPIGGENTNCVIAAHRGSSVPMLRNIHKIKIGDKITVMNFRETLVYRAAEIKIIKPHQISEIKIQPGRDLITLVSCNPLGKNYQRYVLYCERVL